MKLKTERKSHARAAKPEELMIGPAALPEFEVKRILVPVDFSEPSRKALHYATSFARLFKAEIVLLHVIEPVLPVSPYVGTGVDPVDPEPSELAARKELAAWHEAMVPTIRARACIRAGLPSHEIIRAAEEEKIDLIIMSRRGRTGLAHLLLGGTAEYVLRHAPCPSLVVREREHDFIAARVEQDLRPMRHATAA